MNLLKRLLLIFAAAFGSGSLLAQSNQGAATNVSALVTLPPGGSMTLGFVVAAVPKGIGIPYYLIRAVGPSLVTFGVQNPCPNVALKVYNAQGQDRSGYQIGLITAGGEGENWAAVFASVAAFPLSASSGDAFGLFGLPAAGSYTVQVVDQSGKGGSVLVEAYYNAQNIPNPLPSPISIHINNLWNNNPDRPGGNAGGHG